MFNLNSKQTFVVVLVILLGIFLMPVIMAFTGHNWNGKPIKPETIYVHDTIVKHDTVYVRDTIYRTDSLFLETSEVQNLRKTIEHQNKIIKSLMRK